MDIIFALILNSLMIFGVNALFTEGMIFAKLRNKMLLKIKENYLKPLFLCPPCMSSVWGLIGWFVFYNGSIILLPFYCLSLCGLVILILNYMPNESI